MADVKNISPDVVAVISAAVQMNGGGKIKAVRIKRNEEWSKASRGGRR